MKITQVLIGLLSLSSVVAPRAIAEVPFANPKAVPPPPKESPGYPSKDTDVDLISDFKNPPPGYGEVPFWWWTGDPLDKDRLKWQIEKLHEKGISGMQVNYAHQDTHGWPTYPAEPPIFSDEWWDIWQFVAAQCAKRNMGIGLSGYTLDWPNNESLISRTVYSDPEIQGRKIHIAQKKRINGGEAVKQKLPENTIAVRAYPAGKNGIKTKSLNLADFVEDNRLEWTPEKGQWQVWIYTCQRKAGTLNPIHPLAGKRVIEKFFQRFQDHAPNRSSRGLNYFFHDELKFGVGDRIWTEDLPEQFRQRKEYNLFEALPAMFQDVGTKTVKYRLDFMDVKMQLAQERYFIPIFKWHWSRGMIYGCDQGSRGRNPMEFGDYFSAVRWYTAPGHDTPGGKADLIKGKVSSSIAHLYNRPRVWLEGYHSLGWDATPERLMSATCKNYIYGCNLLNLHGLYYTTHGGYWGWAPPSYHFRMPYWEHMGAFLKYFERLSYLMSQGIHQADIAVMYPVSPGQAKLGGGKAPGCAFNAGSLLFNHGYDFVFMDFESLARAKVRNGRLHVADTSYRVLVLPAMRAVRWSTLQKAMEFYRKGGVVIALEALPEASDRAGADDPQLEAAVREIFAATAADAKDGAKPEMQTSAAGGKGIALPGNYRKPLLHRISELLTQDVRGHRIKAHHRKVGPRDVYLVMGAKKGTICTFGATGRAEIWDPWTGKIRPLRVVSRMEKQTTIRMPLKSHQAQVIVFTPGNEQPAVGKTTLEEITRIDTKGDITISGYSAGPGQQTANVRLNDKEITLRGNAPEKLPPVTVEGLWECEFIPTMDNRWGDFRLPVNDKIIGPEARIFRYSRAAGPKPQWKEPDFDDSQWSKATYGYGLKFWKLGPLPKNQNTAAVGARLADVKVLDPDKVIEIDGKQYKWSPYKFSWRWGREGVPGHQGFHGLKEKISDDFIRLGKEVVHWTGKTHYKEETAGSRYYLWTSARPEQAARVKIVTGGGITPDAIYLNGQEVKNTNGEYELQAGPNPLLIRYDRPGAGHCVVLAADSKVRQERTPLSMTWYDHTGLVPLDALAGERRMMGWYRFEAPPGLSAMTVTTPGYVEAWVDGKQMEMKTAGKSRNGTERYRFYSEKPIKKESRVALSIQMPSGCYGGSAMTLPVKLHCEKGLIELGDWSRQNLSLKCYSGGIRYGKTISLSRRQAGRRVIIDLGGVVATAEVRVNDQKAGVRVAPPWTLDISDLVRAGENRIEVIVYNTLANHYTTIPTNYRGSRKSGLMGPVRLRFDSEVTLTQKGVD